MTSLKLKSLKIAATLAVLAPGLAFAQDEAPSPITTPAGIQNTINVVADWFFTIFIALAVVFLIWAAFLYLTAAGNDDKIKSAKNAIIYAIVAIVIAVIAGGVTAIIEGVIDQGSGSSDGGNSGFD